MKNPYRLLTKNFFQISSGWLGLFLAGGVSVLVNESRAATITAPSGDTSVEGSVNNVFPFSLGFDTAEVPSGTQRYQQIYSAGEFGALAPGGEFITQILFRPKSGLGFAFTSTLPDIRIDLSTTKAGVDSLSSSFASNVGANDTIVYGGPTGAALSLSSSYIGPANGPKNFDIVINLTTPFLYNPASGNLLLDVRNFGGGKTTWFDAEDTLGDSISRVTTMASGVGSSTADLADTLGLVTRFTTVVPEPGMGVFLGLGLFGLVQFKRCKRS